MTPTRKVLVVKGNIANLTQTIMAALAREKVTVDSADTIAGGISALKTSPHQVVFLVDSTDITDPDQIHRLAVADPECRLVYVCLPQRSGAITAALAAGALAHLPLPLDPFEIVQTYRRVLTMTPKPIVPTAHRGTGTGTGQLGKVIGVVGSSDNEGKTMVAVNLAAAFAAFDNRPVCIVDLDLEFGDIQWYLNEQPSYTIADIGTEHKVEKKHLTPCAIGIDLLAAPPEPHQAKAVTAETVQAVFQYLRQNYGYIVFDTAAGFSSANVAAIDEADHLIMVSTMDNIAGVKNLKVYLDTLKKLSFPDEAITVVLNRDGAGSLDKTKVEQALGRSFDQSLPNDYQTVSAAAHANGVIVGKDSDSNLAKALMKLAARFSPSLKVEPPAERVSVMDRLRKFLSRP